MPIAMTVFGVEVDASNPLLAYVMLREVRGSGTYPAPHLPKGTPLHLTYRTPQADAKLTLITWDKVFSGDEESDLQNGLKQGLVVLPTECPIASGQVISGTPFGPVIVEEEFQRAPVSGIGLLYRSGVVTNKIFNALIETFDQSLRPGKTPEALRDLVAKLSELSGMRDVLKQRRTIGGVDYYHRISAAPLVNGPLFDILPMKADLKAPMLQVKIRRHAAAADQQFTVQVILKNFEETLSSVLINFKAGVPEIDVTAPNHITDVLLSVFDSAGNLADKQKAQFLQGIQFGLAVQGKVDQLPPPFKGAQKSTDLQVRPRIHTAAFDGPSLGDRSGFFDELRRLDEDFTALIGPRSHELESIWFERGTDSQVEVIRWIKNKVEQPTTARAYLVDPYLGSEALQRVIARQGNESAELVIVLSPGDVDPDASTTDMPAASSHLEKLVRTATDWAENLAGRISIVNIKRGDGSRQAFHDRYLCLIDQKGIPTVFLLSNSLSKAAGSWPFAVSQLDRSLSWRIYAYILELTQGDNLGFQAELIWKSANTRDAAPLSATTASPSPDDQLCWVRAANTLLNDLKNIIYKTRDFKSPVKSLIDDFLLTWSQEVVVERLAEPLYKIVSHRDHILVFVADNFREHGKPELANILQDKLLSRFLERQPTIEKRGSWFVDDETRSTVLESLGRTVVNKPHATNFILANLNPKIHEYVAMIEAQRYVQDGEALQASIYLASIALLVSAESEVIPQRFRIGVANDYIHWLGRIMRSEVASNMYGDPDEVPLGWMTDLNFAAQQLGKARRALGEALETSIGHVLQDPWVSPAFKNTISTALLS